MKTWIKTPRFVSLPLLIVCCLFRTLPAQTVQPYSQTAPFLQTAGEADADNEPDNILIFGGLAFPVGRFSSTEGPSSGFARLGYSLEFQYTHPLAAHLTWISSATLTRNRVDSRAILLSAGLSPDQKVSGGGWSSFWALSGLQWTTPLTQRMSFFLNSQAGVLFGSKPPVSAGENNEIMIQDGQTSSAVAFRVAAGLLTSQSICFAARYEFGQLAYVTSSPSLLQVSSTLPVSLVQIVAGISL